MTYTDGTGIEREIPSLEDSVSIPETGKNGPFTDAAKYGALALVAISAAAFIFGLLNVGDSRSTVNGALLLTLGASGLISALVLGLMAEISTKLTAR